MMKMFFYHGNTETRKKIAPQAQKQNPFSVLPSFCAPGLNLLIVFVFVFT
jgi:hypothetical protein